MKLHRSWANRPCKTPSQRTFRNTSHTIGATDSLTRNIDPLYRTVRLTVCSPLPCSQSKVQYIFQMPQGCGRGRKFASETWGTLRGSRQDHRRGAPSKGAQHAKFGTPVERTGTARVPQQFPEASNTCRARWGGDACATACRASDARP